MSDLRIVFMGTAEFAVPSLELLLEHKFNVIAVLTAPDKPQGRGLKLMASPVKACALRYGIPVLQPTSLKSTEFLTHLKSLNANLQIVVAFRMLPEAIWTMPALGTFNLHASLLPQYRGAAPINWAIINGEKETGITTFFLKHEIDTGGIIFQEKESIHDSDDAGSLYERLMKKGATLVLKTVKAIESGQYPNTAQPGSAIINHAPKIFREICEIHWDQPSDRIKDFVRGLSPYPGAWTGIYGKAYKIFKVQPLTYPVQHPNPDPGAISTDDKSYLYMKSSDGWVSIEELQPEGKRRMNIKEFFMGNRIL